MENNNNPYQNGYQPDPNSNQPQNYGVNNAPQGQYQPQNYGVNNAPQGQYPPQNYGVNNAPQAQYQPQNYGVNNAPQGQYQPQNYGVNNAPQAQYPPQNYGGNIPPQNPYPPQNSGENKPPKKPNRLPLIIGISVAVVAIIAVVLILVLGGGNKSGDECNHKYGDWICDDESLICEDRTYRRVCKKCDKESTRKGSFEDHDFFEFESDSACGHANGGGSECTICGLMVFNNTSFPVISSDDPDVRYAYDEDLHWLECSVCRGRSPKESHVFNSGGVCTYCYYAEGAASNPLAGVYDITMWVPYIDGTTETIIYQEQIDRFEQMHPGIIINARIEGVTESDTGNQVIVDVATAPDIYCFTQDQLARLVQANAIAAPQGNIADQIRTSNDAGSVKAASLNDTLYAYPFTSDNGYFMYYDKSIITPEDAESLERLIEICNENGRTFCFALDNAWYNASFFMATGCESTWEVDANGNFIGLYDTYNSYEGYLAMTAMQMLAQAPCHSNYVDWFDSEAAVVITGVWMEGLAEEVFGSNYAATDLPSFTADGNTYHLGSFCTNKLMGIKPQMDNKRAEVLSLLAAYLTGEECQIERYEEFNWVPSNINAQNSQAVQNNSAVAALTKQSEYATPQGIIHGDWWDVAASLGYYAKYIDNGYNIWDVLSYYESSVYNLIY